MTTTTEALVIGGGPVGLFATLCLVDRGISVEVLDAAGERAVRGYACGLHPSTLRAFDQAGLMPAILEAGHRVDRLIVHGDTAVQGAVDFDTVAGKYPYVLTLRQFHLEDILEQALGQRDLKVRRHHTVNGLRLRDGFITVTGTTTESRASELAPAFEDRRASYVIGADGYFSACRRALGVDLTTVRPTQAFAVCEFLTDLRGWEREAHVALSAAGVSAFWPLGPNLGRFTIQLWKDLDQTLTLDVLRQLLREHAPWFTPSPEQLCWGAVAPFEQRLARRFGQSRLWLAGDAAHSTSPIGFQSMNRGFGEVLRLSELFASALFDEDHRPGRFQRFERDQQAEWIQLFGLRPPAQTSWKASELAACMPASGEDFETLMGQLRASMASSST